MTDRYANGSVLFCIVLFVFFNKKKGSGFTMSLLVLKLDCVTKYLTPFLSLKDFVGKEMM